MYLLVIYSPRSHAEQIRQAAALSGGGKIGNYDSCSFTMSGLGRFRPLQGATPAIGTERRLEAVEEERIELVVPDEETLRATILAVKAVHPYEEPAMHVIPVRDYKDFLS